MSIKTCQHHTTSSKKKRRIATRSSASVPVLNLRNCRVDLGGTEFYSLLTIGRSQNYKILLFFSFFFELPSKPLGALLFYAGS